jgi:hypothetical protein
MIGTMAGPATPQPGWDALRAAQWAAARAAFEADLAGSETAAALDGLARARWWLSDVRGAIEAWERAYTAYRRGGLDEPAAHVAVLLSREHAEGLGNDALANGWLARVRDLLDGYPDSIEWGWVALVESERAVDPAPALNHAERGPAGLRPRSSTTCWPTSRATWSGPASGSSRPRGCSRWRLRQGRPASGSSS